jgi:hypothetical protein
VLVWWPLFIRRLLHAFHATTHKSLSIFSCAADGPEVWELAIPDKTSFKCGRLIEDCGLRMTTPGASALGFRHSETYLMLNGVGRLRTYCPGECRTEFFEILI